MSNYFLKCNECGNIIDVEYAKQKWVWTNNKNVYCPSCVISLNRKLERIQNAKKIDTKRD